MGNITPFWQDVCNQLESRFSKKIDFSDFLRWRFLAITMFHIPHEIEYEDLKNSVYWGDWQKGAIENSFGSPIPYNKYPQSSGNLIHHMYSLLQIVKFADFEINKLKSIYEFGGGYGSFCRMVRNLGFKGNYTIYDFPVFLKLQRMYLMKVLGNIVNLEFTNNIKKQEVDLFISLWALDESPQELCNIILNNIDSDNYLFAINVDKLKYFADFTANKTNHEWLFYNIKHIPNSMYILGRKK